MDRGKRRSDSGPPTAKGRRHEPRDHALRLRDRAARIPGPRQRKAAGMSHETTHFGYETVPFGEKQGRVNDVFHSVARRYDIMNDLMSVGLHRLWKDALVSAARPPKVRPFRHLDVAGGT